MNHRYITGSLLFALFFISAVAVEFIIVVSVGGISNVEAGDTSEFSDYAQAYSPVLDNIYRETLQINMSDGLIIGKIHLIVEYSNLTELVNFTVKVETVKFLSRRPFNKVMIKELKLQSTSEEGELTTLITSEPPVEILTKWGTFAKGFFRYSDIPKMANVTTFDLKYSLYDEKDREFTPKRSNFTLSDFNSGKVVYRSTRSGFFVYRLPADLIQKSGISVIFGVIFLGLMFDCAFRITRNRNVEEFKNDSTIYLIYFCEIGFYYLSFFAIFNYSLASLWSLSTFALEAARYPMLPLVVVLGVLLVSKAYLRHLEDGMNLCKDDRDIYKGKKGKFETASLKDALSLISSIIILMYTIYGYDFVKFVSLSL